MAVLTARVVGNVTRVLVSEGDRIRRGQVLLEIDDRSARANAEQARAAIRAADEAIASATAAVAAAEANARFADATNRRFSALRERGSVSPHEYEEVSARHQAATAELDRARSTRGALVAQRAQAAAAASATQTFLSDTIVRSPIDGIVTSRFVDAGAQAAPGVPLLAVEDAGNYRVETAVPEDLAPAVRIGDTVDIEGIAATVAHVAPVDPRTRSALVKIDPHGAASLRSGTFVHVKFSVGTRSVISIPRAAVVRRGELASVFVVDDHATAHQRPVTIGEEGDTWIEVLSGVEAGERIAVPASAVMDGALVRGTL
jgi:RND family efflux transporter MFP subunit